MAETLMVKDPSTAQRVEHNSRLVFPSLQPHEPQIRGVPLWHAVPMPHDETKPHAHALTSLILFREDGTVAKIYAPGVVPRILYWLAFQAQFPYMRNRDALDAAILRRNLAGMLTEYWYGENRVARAIGIESIDGHYALVSACVQGTAPRDRKRARQFLFDLADRFDAAGLPSWQIDPRQPRSLGNLIQRPDGTFVVIDLESGLVSPLASPRAWWRAFRRGSVPLFDEVYFDITCQYIEREAPHMQPQMGEAWVTQLRTMLDAADVAERTWHDGEPRVWRRLVRQMWALLGMSHPSLTNRPQSSASR